MSDSFVKNFMQAAKKISHAERCLAVNKDLRILDVLDIEQSELQSQEFQEFYEANVREALQSGKVIVTNNRIADPADAPTTNTNFSDLRVVITIPLGKHGAIYMDQHIRKGIMPKEMIERLSTLAQHLMRNGLEDLEAAEMRTLYRQLGETN